MKKLKLGIIALIILYFFWHLYYLDKYPLIDMDDAWETEPTWQLLTTGKFCSPMFEGVCGLEKSDVYHGRLYVLLQAPFLLLFGLGPYQARIGNFLCSIVVLYLLYLIVKKMFNKEIAIKTVFLFSISGLFIILSHRARREMLVLVFLLLSFYIYILGKEKKSLFLFFLSGLIATLSADVHFVGAVLGPLWILILFIIDRRKEWWIYLAGVVVGAVWFVSTHILPDVDLFFTQWNCVVYGRYRAPLLKSFNPLTLLYTELTRYKAWYWDATAHRNMIELIIFLTGIGFAISKNLKFYGTKIFLVTILTFYFLLSMGTHKTPYYLIYLYPFIITLFIKGVEEIKLKNQIFSKLVFAGIIFFYFTQIVYLSVKYKDVNYNYFITRIKPYIPKETILLAEQYLWFGFYGTKFYTPFTITYYPEPGKEPMKFEDFVYSRNVEYLIFDEGSIEKTPELKEFLLQNKLIAEVEDKYFGSGGILTSKKIYKTKIYKVI